MEEYFVEEKSITDKIMDLLVFLAVFVVTIFLIFDIFGNAGFNINTELMLKIYFYVNIIVFVIFFADLVRLWKKSSGAKDFFRHNFLDVLATIPFELIAFFSFGVGPTVSNFGILKVFRLTKLGTFAKASKVSRVSKISKQFKAAAHLKKEGEEYQRKHKL